MASVIDVAVAAASGRLHFDAAQEPEEFCAAFKSIKGIGDWTAQYVAMRALKHPDAFPASDLGLLKSIDAGLKRALTGLVEPVDREFRPMQDK